MSQSPQWPDQWPDEPNQSPGSASPLSRLARSRRGLAAITIVTGVLIMALLATLALVLSSNARSAPAQTGQTGLNGQISTTDVAQTATANGAGGGTSSGGGTPTSGGDGKHTTPTPTTTRGSATSTPTSGVITGCCLTFGPSVHQVASQGTLSGTSVGPAVATCPSGEIALSGGWSIPAHAGAFVYSSARASVRSWAVYVRHGSSLGVTVFIECLANAPGATIVERAAYVTVAPGDTNYTNASCNAGEVAVGGGFYSQTGLVVYGSSGYSTTWGSAAHNIGATPGQLGAYVECLTYAKAHSSDTSKGLSPTDLTPGNGGRAASPLCPSGTYMSGGGFGGPDGVFYAMSAEGSGGATTWAVYEYNNSSGDHAYVQSSAECLGFS
jgi:hypothetical protein